MILDLVLEYNEDIVDLISSNTVDFKKTRSRNFYNSVKAKSRSSSPEVFCEKSVLTNFAKFAGKHLCQSLFCKISKNTFSYKTPLVAASVNHCLLHIQLRKFPVLITIEQEILRYYIYLFKNWMRRRFCWANTNK